MRLVVAAAVVSGWAISTACADEGLWTFEDFPSEAVGRAYGFTPDRQWLDTLRASAVRLPGCSASVVGSDGLIMTNRHCITECIDQLAAPGQNTNMTPILARSRQEERACAGMDASIVVDTIDVTKRVRGAGENLDDASASRARDLEIARIKSECNGSDPTKSCDVLYLYSSSVFRLYVYRKWEDVRVVLAPELAAASFGGDPDNFNFPRYAYDVAFLRLYEHGKPAATPKHLRLRDTPMKDQELVFSAGHPGQTDRYATMATILDALRTYYPYRLTLQSELRGRLLATLNAKGDRPVGLDADLFGVENIFKLEWAEQAAVWSKGVLDSFRQRDEQLKADIAARPEVAKAVGDAWEALDAAFDASRSMAAAKRFLEKEPGSYSKLAGYARTLVRAAHERTMPEIERMYGYADGDLTLLRDQLADDIPIFDARETLFIEFWLSKAREHLTADHPSIKRLLGDRSPDEIARDAVAGTKLRDPAERLRLLDGGQAAIDASEDPLIRLLASIEPDARALDKRDLIEFLGPYQSSVQRLADARFALYGTSQYPDATGSLRISFGKVAAWSEPDGKMVGPFTDFAGLLSRQTGSDPYKLPPLWEAAKADLNPATLFNATTTNDTVGGNSGSPIVDKDLGLVGTMFDGNVHSLGTYFVYDAQRNRSIILTAPSVIEGLQKVYKFHELLAELRD